MSGEPNNMQSVTLDLVSKCCFTIAQATKVTPNLKARVPSYLLSLSLSPTLLTEHQTLHKKPHYTSSAQLTAQHTVAELEGSNLLTVINFPRKQIGPKMSDCLVTGVLPLGVDAETKRAHTVFVRPWIPGDLPSDLLGGILPGSRVGALPRGNGVLVETNPRDLTWDEFTKVHILVGKILAILSSEKASFEDQLLRLRIKVDFGDTVGQKDAIAWFKPPCVDADLLVGRQILAVTNLSISPGAEEGAWFEDGVAAVLTVNGKTIVEPAKEVTNGYCLA